MINYRGIQLFNILFGIVIADTVALAFTLQSDLYIWPLIILIAAVIAAVVVEFHMLRCPKCHSHRAMNAFGFGRFVPGFVFYLAAATECRLSLPGARAYPLWISSFFLFTILPTHVTGTGGSMHGFMQQRRAHKAGVVA